MTENESKLILDVRISRFDHAGDVNEALEIAKQALEEIQKYREIGTVEECREAAEKQKAKKAGIYTDTIQTMSASINQDVYLCPVCGEFICNVEDELPNYCSYCGQAIYW